MLKALYPCAHCNSVFTINYPALYEMGYRGLIFDIDNTLVHHGDNSTPEVDALFVQLHALGFQTLLLTNNDEARVQRFIQNIDTPYICDADKPSPQNYQKAVERMQLDKRQILVIGDQLFIDIRGANRSGLDSILVDFIRGENERKIGKKRYLEKLILFFFRRSKACRNRLSNINKDEEDKNVSMERQTVL